MGLSIGIDIGGTFTDVVLTDETGDRYHIAKVPTTTKDLPQGVIDGLRRVLRQAQADAGEVTRIVHGTTVATNAVLERDGARIGIITTAGFEDTLYIGRAKREEMYNLFSQSSAPVFLCPRRRVIGVPGRAAPDGSIVDELDEHAVLEAARVLVEEHHVEAVAVLLLFSFANPRQEQRIAELISARYPGVYVSLSSQVDPRFREFERLVVTAFDAYIRPMVSRYVVELQNRIAEAGVAARLQIMESHGGVVTADLIAERAVGTLLSGLAGGAAGVAAVGARSQRSRLIGFDMGGTSTDVTLVLNGRPSVGDNGEIGGQRIRVPSVDVHTIGAGGGSIAYVDEAGALRVGPRSAGAVPGPACYDRGGTLPTVTDANLVLGYLGSQPLADGELELDQDAAAEAIRLHLAQPLGMTVVQAAWGVHRLANAAMSGAARVVSVMRGEDPRSSTLVAGGGAGPLHACGVAEELGVDEVLIPVNPGVLSAYGLLAADTQVMRWRTFRARTDSPPQLAGLASALQALDAEVRDDLRKAASGQLGPDAVEWLVGARYLGQSHELTVPVPRTAQAGELGAVIAADFADLHQRIHGQFDPDGVIEVTGVRARGIEPHRPPVPGLAARWACLGARDVFLPGTGATAQVPVIRRGSGMPPLAGPSIITQPDTTIFVAPGWSATPDASGALRLTRTTRQEA